MGPWESGGRLRSLTGSGPEGSSPGELRRVARLLFLTICFMIAMTNGAQAPSLVGDE